jgi:4-amino-4-deoxy-L-arabinose transferase-like glycosyltransferase
MKKTTVVLLLILLLSFGLRVYRLDFQSVWTDEGFVIDLANRTLPELVAVWNISPQEAYDSLSRPGLDLVGLAAETDIHPPLYYFLLHFWLGLTGHSEFALRFLSLFFGLAIVALLFVLGCRLLGEGVGLLAALMGGISPFYLDFSQQVRMYTLVTFLVALSMYVLARAIGGGHWRYWVVYAVANALALYTHYIAIMSILTQGAIVGAVLWIRARGTGSTTSRLGLAWLLAQLATLLLILPWAPYAVKQVTEYQNRSLISPDWQRVLPHTWRAFNLGVPGVNDMTASIAAILLVILSILTLGLLIAWRASQERGNLASLLAYLVVPLAVGLVLFRFKPMFHPKYFMVATPAYFLLLGAALHAFWQRGRWLALPLALFLFGSFAYFLHAYYFDPSYWKDDTRAVAEYLEKRATDRDLILLDLVEPLGYYYRGAAPIYYLPGKETSAPQRLARLAADRERVFLVHYEHAKTDPQGLIPFLLSREGKDLGQEAFRGYTVREYHLGKSPRFQLKVQPRERAITFEDRLSLVGWQLGVQGASPGDDSLTLPSGGKLWAILGWRSLAPMPVDYKAALYLTDTAGHIAGQNDILLLKRMEGTAGWQPGDQVWSYHILQVLPGVPPGYYSLRLAVYEAATARRLGALSHDGTPLGAILELQKVQVIPSTSPRIVPTDMATPLGASLGPVKGLGYSLAQRRYRAGETVHLTLFLRALQEVGQDLKYILELRDGQGRPVWRHPSFPTYPTSRWRPGELVRDWQDLTLPASLPAGEYRLWLTLEDVTGAGWDLGAITLLARERLFAPPPIAHPLRAELGDKVSLLGYQLEGAYRPGGTLNLTLYWQALGEMEKSYTVFTHLLDGASRIWAQHDGVPGGDKPTSGWVRGEIVIDRHTLLIKDDAPAGEYTLEVGMYDPATGIRLRASASQVQVVDDALWLTRVKVK